MFVVTMINGIERMILNDGVVGDSTNKIFDGKIKQAINMIDSFTFKMYFNHPHISRIRPRYSRIEVFNTKTNRLEFEGRVMNTLPSMDDNGLFTLEATCEGTLSYLHDSCQRYQYIKNTSILAVVTELLRLHNLSVDKYKVIQIGTIAVTSDPFDCVIDYASTYSQLFDVLVNRFGGEIEIRNTDGVLYLDYLKEPSEPSRTTIAISKNLRSVEKEIDVMNMIGRIIPLGPKLEGSDERMTIKSVNDNKDWINDQSSMNSYGTKDVAVIFDDVADPSALKAAGEKYIANNNKVKVKYNISALDLYYINLDIYEFRKGHKYKLVNPVMGVDEDVRIIEKTIDIHAIHNSELVVGDKFYDMKDYNTNTIKMISSVRNSVTTNGQIKAEEIRGVMYSTKTKLLASKDSTQTQDLIMAQTEDLNTTSPSYGSVLYGTNGISVSKNRSQQRSSGWNYSQVITPDGVIAEKIVGNMLSSKNGLTWLDMNTGAMQIVNRHGEVVLDDSSTIFKIRSVTDLNINANDSLDNVYTFRHNLGYVPAFIAFKIDSPTSSTGNSQLPVITTSGISNGSIQISSTLQATADNNNIYIRYSRANLTITSSYKIRLYIYKEKML